MKIVNDTLKNALKQPTTQRKGRILVNGNYYDVYNVEYNADAYNEGNVIGNAIASQLDFDLPYMPKFDTFKYFDGAWTGNGYEYIDMGTFTVFDENDEDDFNKHITSFDNLIKFNAPFTDDGEYPKTLFQELQNVCEQAGVVLNNTNIPNGSFRVENNQFVNDESLKTVLKAICQISGTYAIIKNDEVVLQLKNNTNEVLNKNQHEPVIWKRRTYGINQVVLGMKDVEGEYVLRENLEDIAENGVHKLVINDNPFAYTEDKRAELIDELFNQVKGFGYVPFEMNGEWLSYLDIGDTITLDGIETLILRINGKSPKALESVMSAPAIIDSSVDYINNTNSIENQMKRTEIIVNKQNQEIQALASKVVPVSNTIKGVRQIQLENAYEGVLHHLSIKGNISLLFPNSNLYPNTNLYSKSNILLIDDEEYKLDFNFLNYINDKDCDEFVYEDGKCWIIRRVGVDNNGDLYATGQEVVEERNNIVLNIKNNSIIKLKSFDNVIFESTYLLQNEYTDNFVTSVDVVSKINLSPGNVQIEATKLAQITADKINLEGYTTINGGFSVDKEGNATMNNATINGGDVKIYSENNNPRFSLISTTNKNNKSELDYRSFRFSTGDYSMLGLVETDENFGIYLTDSNVDISVGNAAKYTRGEFFVSNGNQLNDKRVISGYTNNSTSTLTVSDNNGRTIIYGNSVNSPAFNNSSKLEMKKNISPLKNGLSIIKKGDIYSYNWKKESDNAKKHYGLIIGDKYKVPEEIISITNDGIDTYSMISIAWQAIKDLNKKIEYLEKKVEELENGQ